MTSTYGQFCPISMAAEVVCSRWTVLLIRELLCGSTRFNDLRRGIPRMSPSLLSKRLKELEEIGIIRVAPSGQKGINDYRLTEAGEELRPLVFGLGNWGYRWLDSRLALQNLDPTLLMWDMRRGIDPAPFPAGRSTVQFEYPDLPASHRHYWLVIEEGSVDVCWVDPGFDVDLWVSSPLRVMTSIWMGYASLRTEMTAGRILVHGNQILARSMAVWLGLSGFARSPDGAPTRNVPPDQARSRALAARTHSA